MMYNNLIYFLVAIFVFSTNTPAAKPVLPPFWALAAIGGVTWGFARVASLMFARSASGSTSYFSVEKKLSILAVLVFVGFVYLLDLKYYLHPLSLDGRLPVLADIAGLGCFFLLLILMWRAARFRYQDIFQRQYTAFAFVRSNFKANLPIILPWLVLSLVFDGLRALPFPGLAKFLRSPWGDLTLFAFFLFFPDFGFSAAGPFSLGLFTLVTRAGAEPALGLLPGPRLSVGNLLLAAFRGAGSDCRYYGDRAETALSDDNPCAPRDPERG